MNIDTIHAEFHRVLDQYITARIKNRDDAADVLQEVFIKIAAKLDSLSDSAKMKSWIFTITRNAIIDYYRRNAGQQKAAISEQLADEMMEESADDFTRGLDKCLNGFIHQLPPEYRDVIIDSEIKGIKQKDLADKYNLAYPSLRSRVQRGRTRLREMLLHCCNISADSRGNILERSSNNGCNTACNNGCS